MAVTLSVNGVLHTLSVDSATPLVFVLRNALGLTGTKLGCASEQCGACAVLVDGQSVLSCVAPCGDFAGREITTVEGVGDEQQGLSRIQRALVEHRAAQCGYCTPGIVIALTALLAQNPAPSRSVVKTHLSGHLCRCGSHANVLRAVDSICDGEIRE